MLQASKERILWISKEKGCCTWGKWVCCYCQKIPLRRPTRRSIPVCLTWNSKPRFSTSGTAYSSCGRCSEHVKALRAGLGVFRLERSFVEYSIRILNVASLCEPRLRLYRVFLVFTFVWIVTFVFQPISQEVLHSTTFWTSRGYMCLPLPLPEHASIYITSPEISVYYNNSQILLVLVSQSDNKVAFALRHSLGPC